jgi:hydroxymethylglutaryl-CoA lyase
MSQQQRLDASDRPIGDPESSGRARVEELSKFERDWEAALPKRVRLVEVGPRDGLQNIDRFVSTEVKISLIDRLSSLGFDRIEAVSFVHPSAVPQMRDAEAIMRQVQRGQTRLMGLVPNARGTERALAAGLDELNFVVSATESFNQANLRQSIASSLASLAESMAMAGPAGMPMRMTISTAFGCPYEGHVSAEQVLAIAERGAELGCHEICLGDTTGMANPRQVFRLFGRMAKDLPGIEPAVHLHNTRGSGAANLIAALQAGVEVFDASIGGLGGCPYAPGATGNVCSEDMVHMLQEMAIETGIDLERLIDTARRVESVLGLQLPGQVMRAGIACAISTRPG